MHLDGQLQTGGVSYVLRPLCISQSSWALVSFQETVETGERLDATALCEKPQKNEHEKDLFKLLHGIWLYNCLKGLVKQPSRATKICNRRDSILSKEICLFIIFYKNKKFMDRKSAQLVNYIPTERTQYGYIEIGK